MFIDTNVHCRSFRGASGDDEHFVTIVAPENLDFEAQAAYLKAKHIETQNKLGISPDTAVFERFFLSDAVNRLPSLLKSPLFSEADRNPVAASIVQQQPLPGSKVALLAYHLDAAITKKKIAQRHLLVEKNGRRHLWSAHICGGSTAATSSEEVQTRDVFRELTETLERLGGNLKSHCVRTWIYMKGVDVIYRGMANTRRALFADQGLTEDTHYIASTGIEGGCEHPFDVVMLDAYSFLDLDGRQISYLNDFDRLCPTKKYNVTFERGTRIAYADRLHLFISGTASIDRAGNTLYAGDVMRQLGRTVENVEALLKSGGGGLDDMMYLIVYLRDPTDFAIVEEALSARLPETPMIFAQAAVCRPEWLVEIEGQAVIANHAAEMPDF